MPEAALGRVQREGAIPTGRHYYYYYNYYGINVTPHPVGGFPFPAGTAGSPLHSPTYITRRSPLKSDGKIKPKVKVQSNLYLSRHDKSNSFTLRGLQTLLSAK